jgi:nucleotide-binding universal stress UspA family protein
MSKNVLLAVDLNHDASWEKALPEAVRQAEGGALHVLTIVPDFGMTIVAGFFPPDFEANAVKAAAEKLEELVKARAPAGVDPTLHVGLGHVPEEILRVAGETSADLIVMASHPPDVMRELLVGSNADRVVRHAPVSVMVVR